MSEENVSLQIQPGELGQRFADALKGTKPEAPKAPKAPETKVAEPPKEAAALTAKPLDIPEVKATPPAFTPALEAEAKDGDKGKDKKKDKAYNFRLLETENEGLKSKSSEMARRIAELEARTNTLPPPEEVDKLKGELNKYQDLVARFYVEQDPRFQAAFDAKINGAVSEATAGLDAEVVKKLEPALRNADAAQVKAIAYEMEDMERIQVLNAFTEIKKVRAAREAELSKARDNVKQIKDFDRVLTQEQQQERTKKRQAMADAALTNAAQHFEDFRKRDGNDPFNKLVEENSSLVRQWGSQELSPEDQSKLAVWAVRGYRAAEKEAAANAIITKLQAQVKSLQAASPGLSAGGRATSAPKGATDDADPLAAMAAKFHEAMDSGIPEAE